MKPMKPPAKKVLKTIENNQPQAVTAGASYASLGFQPVKSKHTSRAMAESCQFSIVDTKKNGKRIMIESEVLDNTGVEDLVQFSVISQGIAFGKNLPDCGEYFPVKKRESKKGKVYSKPLIAEVVEAFNLDFSNKTTISFQEIIYLDHEGTSVAFVPIKQMGQTETESEQLEVQSEEEFSDTSALAEEAEDGEEEELDQSSESVEE